MHTAGDDGSFDVFLSHGGRDKEEVRAIAERLRAAGLRPWLDEEQLEAGRPWQAGIVAGLRASRACAFFIGRDSASAWANEELQLAQDRAARDQAFALIPVLLPGLPAVFDYSYLPPLLSMRTWVDLRAESRTASEFQKLVAVLRRQEREAPVPDAPEPPCPYQGLLTFDEKDAGLFFGREADVQRLAERLKGTSFLGVVGPSGSGKSSLVRAGLLPALRAPEGDRRFEHIVLLRPGARPLEELAFRLLHASRRSQDVQLLRQYEDELRAHSGTLTRLMRLLSAAEHSRHLLVVDQFEELFTLCDSDVDRTAFVANLLTASHGQSAAASVIIAMRADFYAKCASNRDLAVRLAAHQYLVSPMSEDGLRDAIERPAHAVGLRLEPGLVETIIGEVASQPGALPLLELLLVDLWEQRSGRELTLDAFVRSGGIRGIVARRADALYGKFTPDGQQVVKRLMLRLTQPGEGTEDTRRRASLDEVASSSAADRGLVNEVVATLAQARLVITGRDELSNDTVVDVAHEALIRGWPMLRSWLDEDREGLRVLRKLTEASADWHRTDRDDSLLFRGTQLQRALDWSESHASQLSDLEAAFLKAAVASRDTETRAREAALERELEMMRQLAAEQASRSRESAEATRILERRARVGLGLTIASVVLAIVALSLKAQGDRQSERVRFASAQAAAASLVARDPTLAALVLAELPEGFIGEVGAVAAEALGESLVAQTQLHGTYVGISRPTAEILTAYYGPHFWKLDGTRSQRLIQHEGVITGGQTALHEESGAIAIAGTTRGKDPEKRVIAVWASPGEAKPLILEGHEDYVNSVRFSADGGRLITTSGDKTARIWPVSPAAPPVVLKGHTETVLDGLFSADGDVVATTSVDRTVRLWRADGTLSHTFEVGTIVRTIAFAPSGRQVLGVAAKKVWIWRADSGAVVRVLDHPDDVLFAAFSPDGSRVATSSADGAIRLWPVDGQGDAAVTQRHSSRARSVAFSNDGSTLVSVYEDETVRVWAIDRQFEPLILRGHEGVTTAAFTPDGRHVITASPSATRLWPTRLPADRPVLQHPGEVLSAEFSPDGRRVATACEDGIARIWDLGTNEVTLLRGHSGAVVSVAFAPSGDLLVTGGADKTARVWRADGSLVTSLSGHAGPLRDARFSSDGTRVITASVDATARIWDVQSGAERGVFRHLEVTVLNASFSADDAEVFTATRSSGDSLHLWRADGSKLRSWGGDRGWFGLTNHAGTRVLSGNFSRVAMLWNRNGVLERYLPGHRFNVTAGAFSRDDTTILTASDDGTVRLWKSDGSPRWPVQIRHANTITSAAFSPDGLRIVTSSSDRTVRLWPATWSQVVAALRARTNVCLTAEERREYLTESESEAASAQLACGLRQYSNAPTEGRR